MEDELFFQLCIEHFSYLTTVFGFSEGICEKDVTSPRVMYKKPGFRVEIVNYVIGRPDYPIQIFFVKEEKKFFNLLHSLDLMYDFDDLLLYKKCTTNVYEFFNYENFDSFYTENSIEKYEYYKEKYSKDEEIMLIINKYSRLLREYGIEVLEGNYDVLPEASKLREEYEEKYDTYLMDE